MVTCFLTAEGKTVVLIYRESVQMHGENCINVSNVQRWKKDFENNCCVSLEDEWDSKQLALSLTVDYICRVCESLEAYDRFTRDKIVACMPPVGCGWPTMRTIIIHNMLQL